MQKTNPEINRIHYEEIYKIDNARNILHWLNNLESFLETVLKTEISWFAIYNGDFKNKIRGKKVLELGCGDCTNAAIMAALGAEVYANDIAESSGRIIEYLNKNYDFEKPIKFIKGDFLENKFSARTFDYIIGKAFLHHLEIPLELKFLQESHRLLKSNGEARFFEPAVNCLFFDLIRWYIPVGKRPSKFSSTKFKQWKANDPHPDRTFSSKHFASVGKNFFGEVEIHPVGTIERFSQFFRWGNNKNQFKRWALRTEKFLPNIVNTTFARSQLIIYRLPL